jgi:hypothetical protein
MSTLNETQPLGDSTGYYNATQASYMQGLAQTTPDFMVLLWRDKSIPKGWLYDWTGIARRRKQDPETRFCRKLAPSLLVCVEAISNRCSKDSSCALRG